MTKTSPVEFFSRLYLPFWITACAIATWSLAAALINPAQFADNLEQFSWSHSLEWGYWKHPPLPTWLIAVPIRLIGFSVYWTYGLAATCFIGTAFFTWRITLRLFGWQAGMFAVLLIGLHIGFSWRAQLYNHNTVLILMSAATVWATLRALDSGKKTAWVLSGVLAGLAMLSKYQALVPLLGIVLALWFGGWFKQKSVRQGAAIAAATALLLFAPHLMWVATGTGSTIDNALHAAEGLGPLRRLTVLFGFWMVQIRFYTPILIAVALLVLFKSGRAVSSVSTDGVNPSVNSHVTTQTHAWLLGLIVWPAFVVSMVVLMGGVRLEAQWGLQTFQFLVIFIAWRLSIVLPQVHLGHAIRVVLVAQLVLAGFFVWSVMQPSQSIWKGARERNFPAAQVAKEVTSKWSSATRCPLKFVVGPSFEATIVSAYSGQNPAVLEDGDFKKAPWITAALIKQHGAVYLASKATKWPSEVSLSGQLSIPARQNDMQPASQLFWGLVLPQMPCSVPG